MPIFEQEEQPMKGTQKFFKCDHCGNIVGLIEMKGAPLVCCNEHMKELIPNTTEASTEKHLPEISVNGDTLTVQIGSTAHPMEPEHHILFVYVESIHGGQRKALQLGSEPKMSFGFCDDEPLAVYAYCNLHGLWKTEV